MIRFKKNSYKFWHSPIVLFLLFCFFILFGYNIISLINKERDTSYKKELILNEINDLKEKEVTLNENIAKLKTEEGQEEVIREKYQVAKPGEKMVVIVDEDRNQSSEMKDKDNHSFWNWLKNLFK